MLKRALIAWILVLCVSSFQASGQPVPPVIVPTMENESDLIVTGRIFDRTDNINREPNEHRYNIVVSSVLKGTLPKTTSSIVFKFSGDGGGLGVGIPSRGIFFLKPADDGTYTNADPNWYSVVAAAGANRRKQDDASPMIKIARELTNVLATPPEAIIAERPDLRAKVGTSVEITEEVGSFHTFSGQALHTFRIPVTVGIAAGAVYGDAMRALSSMPSAVTGPALRDALDAPMGVSNRLWLIAALTEAGDVSRLHEVAQMVDAPHNSLLLAIHAFGPAFQSTFSSHQRPGMSDLTPALMELLSSPVPGIRRVAANALLGLGPVGIKPLTEIALHDQDMEVRFIAETGLCWMLKRSQSPCNLPFGGPNELATEATYRKYWTDWAAANQAKNGGKPPAIP